MNKISKENILSFMRWFNEQNGYYPTREEFQKCPQRPCAVRTIERSFGGLVKIREELGVDNPDHRTGNIRSVSASNSMKQSIDSENEFYKYLVEKYEKLNVHRWQPYLDRVNKRSDYGIYHKNGEHYFIDIFWASTCITAIGCINIKLRKIPKETVEPVYLVCTNSEIDILYLYKKLKNKKNKIPKNIIVLGIDDFKKMAENF